MKRLRENSIVLKRSLIALACLAWAGTASAGLLSDDEARSSAQQALTRVQAVEDSLAQQQQGRLDLLQQIEQLKQEVAQLRGQAEVLTNDLENTQKRQKDFYVDLDTRMRRLEGGGAVAASAVAASDNAGKDGKNAVLTSTDPAQEAKAYETALGQFKVGNYAGAVVSFQGFMTTYPKSGLAPSAQYWIGNSYFSLRDFKSAVREQQKLISNWPDSEKVPDALLNIASSQQELGQDKAARKTLETLVSKYPLSPAAEKAKARLDKTKQGK